MESTSEPIDKYLAPRQHNNLSTESNCLDTYLSTKFNYTRDELLSYVTSSVFFALTSGVFLACVYISPLIFFPYLVFVYMFLAYWDFFTFVYEFSNTRPLIITASNLIYAYQNLSQNTFIENTITGGKNVALLGYYWGRSFFIQDDNFYTQKWKVTSGNLTSKIPSAILFSLVLTASIKLIIKSYQMLDELILKVFLILANTLKKIYIDMSLSMKNRAIVCFLLKRKRMKVI